MGAKPSALTLAAGSPGGARGPEAPASPTAGGRLCRCRLDRHRPLLPEPGPGPSPHRRRGLRQGPGSQQPGTPDQKVCASVPYCAKGVASIKSWSRRIPRKGNRVRSSAGAPVTCSGRESLGRLPRRTNQSREDPKPQSPLLPPLPPVQARSAPARACTCPVPPRVRVCAGVNVCSPKCARVPLGVCVCARVPTAACVCMSVCPQECVCVCFSNPTP